MEKEENPRPGQIYRHREDKPYQIITIAADYLSKEKMVVYQELFGGFQTYVIPYKEYKKIYLAAEPAGPEVNPTFDETNQCEETKKNEESLEKDELHKGKNLNKGEEPHKGKNLNKGEEPHKGKNLNKGEELHVSNNGVDSVLMDFLDSDSYSSKLDIITSNRNHLNHRLIDAMAMALDITIEEGALDERIQGLIHCLQAMCRFEGRRLR